MPERGDLVVLLCPESDSYPVDTIGGSMARPRLSVRRIVIGALSRLGLLENFFDLRRRVRQACVLSLATARRRGYVRAIGELRPTQRIIRVGCSWQVADIADSFVAFDVMTSNVFTVLDALSAFNIPVFWQPLAEPTRFGVGVTEANRLATWQALRAASEGQSLYASPVGAAGRSQRLLSSAGDAIPNDLRRADAWHVFREITSPMSLGHHGADVSAVIVFWKHRRVDDVVNARSDGGGGRGRGADRTGRCRERVARRTNRTRRHENSSRSSTHLAGHRCREPRGLGDHRGRARHRRSDARRSSDRNDGAL